jgi:ketosteroid isomerase-like protein
MHSQETIQALVDARAAGLKEASEKRDVDALMSWHSKDAVFNDVGMDAEPLTRQ